MDERAGPVRRLRWWSLGALCLWLSAGPASGQPGFPVAESAPAAPLPQGEPCLGSVVGMACIPGGPFERGSRRFRREQTATTVWVDTFYMDVTEVTVEAFEACVARGACTQARTIYEDYSRPRQPKVGISWYHAVGFCQASGKHLPTEAEWEKAARGTDGRTYPWGNERATCQRAVIEDHRGRSCGIRKRGGSADTGRTFEVGTLPPNPYGLFDMSGNAWEWVHDWYSSSYDQCGAACQGPNPRGPCDGAEPCPGRFYRVVRGGSWFWDADYATTTFRHYHYPKNEPYHHYGFRCAASLEEARRLTAAASAQPRPPA